MRVLFLSHYFPPEVNAPASRTFEHCKQWVKKGHQVTIITCVPNHPLGKVFSGYKNKLIQKETIEGIEVIRLITYITANEGFFKRTLNYVFYMIASIIYSIFLPKYDIVLSTSPQFFNGLAGYFVSRIKSIPWILEIRDLWPESILALGVIKNKQLIYILKALEKFCYKNCDHIISVTHSFCEHIEKCDINKNKISVVRNGVNLDFFDPEINANEYKKELGLEGKFIVSYMGTLGLSHGLGTVIECAQILRKYDDVFFLIVGEGAGRKEIESLIAQKELKNILILPLQPKAKMPSLLSISSINLILLKRLELFKTVIPSKMFESMAMKKTILLGVEGEAASILNEAVAGIAVEPENSSLIATHIMSLKDNLSKMIEFGNNGRAYVEKHFNRNELAEKVESEMARLVNSKK